MKNSILLLLTLLSFCACQNQVTEKATEKTSDVPVFQNKAHELVHNMVQKTGTYAQLAEAKDVVYTYTYETADGKKDISTEKYLFDGELSYASYAQHERTLADLEGTIEQGFDGSRVWLKHNGIYVEDSVALKRVLFNRKTNFYWFAMMQKLMDPGLQYEYIKEAMVDNTAFDIVKVSFNSESPTDIYQLYINKNTGLVDQFLFTVADFGVMENPLLMRVEYEKIGTFLIPSKRIYTKSNWEGNVLADQWTKATWTDIKFNNGLDKELFLRAQK